METVLALAAVLFITLVLWKRNAGQDGGGAQPMPTEIDFNSPISGDSVSSGASDMGIPLWQAIARQEGYFVSGSRADRNNNPGNLEYGPFAISMGATGSDGRFAIFPDAATGWNALKALLLKFYRGLTLQDAISKYAPSNENDTATYVNNVSQWTGLGPDQPVDSALVTSNDSPGEVS